MKITRHENFNLSFHRKVLKEKFLFILIRTIKKEAKNEICIIDVYEIWQDWFNDARPGKIRFRYRH